MKMLRRTLREAVLGLLGAVALVALVLGHTIIGLVVGVLVLWQVITVARGNPGLFVDQREADKEGKPTLR